MADHRSNRGRWPLPSPRILWAAVGVTALLAIALLVAVPRLQPHQGTVVLVVAGPSATTIQPATLFLFRNGGWTAVGQVSGAVPAAPDEREVMTFTVPTGTYGGVRIGPEEQPLNIEVAEGKVVPILLGFDGAGHLIPGAAYSGNDEVNLGLGELSGKFVAMPDFNLVDQHNLPFNRIVIAGKEVVIAAFHTTCHETCPLYTALLAQLAKHVPPKTLLVEVTTDPADTTGVLAAYAKSVGADWTFATGSKEALTAFWKPFGVELATGDSHVSTLALLDSHGFVRLVYRGVPDVGHAIDPVLVSALSANGLQQLASGGDGWGAAQILQALLTIGGPDRPSTTPGGPAPDFSLDLTDGSHATLAELKGKVLVINFWANYCPPCRAEMPMLQRVVGGRQGVLLVLVNEGDSSSIASGFLDSVGVHQASLLDSDLKVGRAYGVIALPTTVFVKADGTIAAVNVGQLDERVLTAQLSTLGGQ